MKPGEFAKRTGLSPASVYRGCKTGAIPCRKIGRRIVITDPSLPASGTEWFEKIDRGVARIEERFIRLEQFLVGGVEPATKEDAERYLRSLKGSRHG